MKPPPQGPIIDIPGIDDATQMLQVVHGRGESWLGLLTIDDVVVRLDPASDWFDRDWFALFLAEIMRREKTQRWTYDVATAAQGYLAFLWTVQP